MINVRQSLPSGFPEIVTLCGSTKFKDDYEREQARLTSEGIIVISVGRFGWIDGLDMSGELKKRLDELHLRKIDISDRIHVINVNMYVGESTRREIDYAISQGKRVTYLNPLSPID